MWRKILNQLRPKTTAAHLQTGADAERRARRHLEAQGLVLVARNYRCPRGEIDLLMRDGQTLVVVEVRYRQSVAHGSPLESVTRRKQSRIIAATRHYLAGHPSRQPLRFDVVAISGTQIDWVRNAFQA